MSFVHIVTEIIDFAEKNENYVYHFSLIAKNSWENLHSQQVEEKADFQQILVRFSFSLTILFN